MSPPDPRRPYRPSRSRAASAVLAVGLVAGVLAAQAGLPWAGLAGLTVAVLVGWRLRFRPSTQARAWRRGAAGERHTARLLDRLGRDGYVVFHDLAMPDSPANLDHLVVGPSGVFVIDSKQWAGQVHQSSDGLIWHNHYRLHRTMAALRWQADPRPPPGHPGCPAGVRAWRQRPGRRAARPGRVDHARPPAS